MCPSTHKHPPLNKIEGCHCREQEERIGGKNSLCFSLIHCEYIYIYIYTKINVTFLIDYNSICKVDICYNTPPQIGA